LIILGQTVLLLVTGEVKVMNIRKISFFVVALLCVALLVSAGNYKAIYNPIVGKMDYVNNGNFSGINVTLGGGNVSDVQCVLFTSGGQICDSP